MVSSPTMQVNAQGKCHIAEDDGRLKEEAWLPLGDADMPYPMHLQQVGDGAEDISNYQIWSLPGDAGKNDFLRRGLYVNSYYVDYYYSQIAQQPRDYEADLQKVATALKQADGKTPDEDEVCMALARQKAMLRIMGEAYRSMPTPSALPAFSDLLRIYEQHDGMPVALILGPPGMGKTSLANMVGNLVDPRGAVYFDCGGKDMTELIDKLVFKNQFSKSARLKIDKCLEESPIHLSPKTHEALEWLQEQKLAKAEKGRVTILWDKIPERFSMSGESLEEIGHDPRNKEKWKEISGHLRTIVEAEKLDTSLGNDDFPFEIIDGPLLEAYNQDRVLVLDELNRYRRDSIEGFRNLFLFMTKPRQASYLYTRKNGTVVSFERDKILHSRTLSILATGNDNSQNESTARDLDASLKERFKRIIIPEANNVDYAHAFCREIAGLPIVTLAMMYGVDLQQPAKDPQLAQEFSLFLHELYDLGKTEDEKTYEPQRRMKLANIDNWKGTLRASQSVASAYYDTWFLFNDPQKALAASADQSDIVNELENPRGYKTNVSPGMRLMLEHIRDAMDGNVIASAPSKPDLSPSIAALSRIPGRRPKASSDPAALNLGESFSLVAEGFLRNKMQLQGKQKTWTRLHRTFEENGILAPEVSIAARTGSPLQLKEMLSGNPILQMPPDDASQMALLIEQYLREKYRLSHEHDLGITTQEISHMMQEMHEIQSGEKLVTRPHARAHIYPLIEDGAHILDVPAFGKRSFVNEKSYVVDATRNVWQNEPSLYDQQKDLAYVDHDQFVLSLVAPKFRDFAKQAIFTNGIAGSGIVPEAGQQPPPLEIAQNRYQFPVDKEKSAMAGLGITTVMTKKGTVTEPVHVIARSHPEMTLIVGGTTTLAMQNYLRGVQLLNRNKPEDEKNHIYYVDRHDSHAEEKIEQLIKYVTESKDESREEQAARIQNLKDAFMIRNHPSAEGEQKKITDLKKLMTQPRYSECELPNYAVHADLQQVIAMVGTPREPAAARSVG